MFFEIESALQQQLHNIPGSHRIIFDNVDNYKPQSGVRFWRPTNIPIQSETKTFGGVQKVQGFYQVSVFTSTDDGLKDLLNDLDAINDAFNSTRPLLCGGFSIHTYERTIGKVFYEKNWTHSYIQINYACYSE